MFNLLSLNWYLTHQVYHGDGVVSLGVDQPHGRLLSDSLSLDCSWREGLPVQGSVFLPFYSSPDFYQSGHPGVRVGSWERGSSPLLSC